MMMMMPVDVDDDDDDARRLVGWLSTRCRTRRTEATSEGGGGDGGDDVGVGRASSSWVRFENHDADADAPLLRKRTDDADDAGRWFFDGGRRDDDVDDVGGRETRPLDGYHYRRVGLDAAERALDAELDAVERALADGGRGLDEAFGFAFASAARTDEVRNDDDVDKDGNGVIDEPPKMWNARFVGDVLSTTPGRRSRLDEVVEEEEEEEEEEDVDEWRFSPPPDAGVFAASIPVVSERVVEGETFTSRLDDILDRVDVARALAMEAKRQLFLNSK
jgi:hypothetical protein